MDIPAVDANARRHARRALLQGFTQAMVTDADADETERWLRREGLLDDADHEYFASCLHDVVARIEEIDAHYEPFLDRSRESLGQVECTALRLGTYELLVRDDVPYRVVINEWVELTKDFGATNSFRYINGILDRVAMTVRGP